MIQPPTSQATSQAAPQPIRQSIPRTVSDTTLLETAIYYGTQARLWRNKLLGLLPEINRRALYKQRGCGSIFEFAFKIGGVSEEQVKTVIRTEESLHDKPHLHELLISGEISINKMVRIHAIATPENEELLANQAQILPQKALETLARDMQRNAQRNTQNHDSSTDISFMRAHEAVPLPTETSPAPTQSLSAPARIKLISHLDESTAERLLELQNKGIDMNKLINDLLDQRERDIEDEKEKIGQEGAQQRNTSGNPSRYIPVRIKKLIKKEHGEKCSIPYCTKPSEHLHHTRRYALDQSHDPHYLAPLCREHHIIAHAIDVHVQEMRHLPKKTKP